jgi:PAS domain S-box-containing protein
MNVCQGSCPPHRRDQPDERKPHRLDDRTARAFHLRANRVALASSGLALLVVALSTLAVNAELRRRVAVERSLRESEERLRVTLRSIGDAVIATDPAGRVVLMNGIAQTLTGWSDADARGRPLEAVFRIVNEHTHATVESPVVKVLREGTVVGPPHRVADAGRRRASIDDSRRRSATPLVKSWAVLFRDVTDRKRQERARAALGRGGAHRGQRESRRMSSSPSLRAAWLPLLASRAAAALQSARCQRAAGADLDVSHRRREAAAGRSISRGGRRMYRSGRQAREDIPESEVALRDRRRPPAAPTNLPTPSSSRARDVDVRCQRRDVVIARLGNRAILPRAVYLAGSPAPRWRVDRPADWKTVSAESDGRRHSPCVYRRARDAAGAERCDPAPRSDRSTLDGVSVLVVDDDPQTRESLALLLQTRGASVRHVGSAVDALNDCARQPPDVVISDISMPEQDGYEFIETLRRQRSARQPVALALTGFAGPADRTRASEAGFDAHVAKPIDLDALVQTIFDLLAAR